jgi:MFS transporter, PPP family, 3-phenylpropionic acid transporter
VHEAVRYALLYVALFMLIGVQLPFWPVWLADRGMDADRIGWLLGSGAWARLVAPWVGAWVDRSGRGAAAVALLAGGVVLTLLAFSQAHGFVGLMVLSIVLGLCVAPIIPVVDALVIGGSSDGRFDYGRVRLWGSLAFVLASIVGGQVFEGRPTALVLIAMQLAAVLVLLGALRLPTIPRSITPTRAVPVAEVLHRPGMVRFLVATGFMQAGHAVLYGFATEHWLTAGIDEGTIGWLWATGVIGEIAVFAIGQRLVARIGPKGLLLCAGLGATLRWVALAEVTEVAPLFALQLLHAASFAALHLGAMSWIRASFDGAATQRATALYVAVGGGIALGTAMPIAGMLYDRWAGAAFYAMAVSSGIGLLLAWRLRSDRPAPM